jgi:hypothetical protein
MQVSSTQPGISASDPYYFVLNKNGAASDVTAAVQSLGVAPSLVQWIVPEPGCAALAGCSALFIAGLCTARWRYWKG